MYERLLSESSRPYVLAYYMSAIIDYAYFKSHVLKRKHKALNASQVVRKKNRNLTVLSPEILNQYSPVL
jgi:hypothetical protein